ncbi:unnamed protein product [Staurois parvus]|uniref:Uncharacterized protein n=1 Tax=Staurois parvus TaxID=386267 RepID=A0ABN9FLM7_9NEOB|nr:unnamed protein product [Staurois parvus]
MALLCRAIQSSVQELTGERTQRAYTVKQHTDNPFSVPDVNPFLPSVISSVSVLFISTDHYISVTGDVSDSQSPPPPPSVRMPTTVSL